MNIILSMSSFIFPLITFPYVSRVLTPTGYGKFSFAQATINYFAMFASLGIPTYGIRICAKNRDNKQELSKVAQELLYINLFTACLSFMALIVAIFLVGKFNEEKAILLLMSLTLFLTAIGMEWLYKALEQYSYITIRSLIFKAIAVVFMFMMIHQPEDYVIYGGISIFAACASNILNFINVHRYISLKPSKDINLKKHIKPILVFFAMSCATIIYTNMDVVMLGFMKSDEEVAYYEAAIKIKKILVSIVTSLGAVLLPRASYYIEHNENEKFLKMTKKAFNFVILFALPLTIYFIIYAKEGIVFLSGEEYLPSVVPMQILMPTLILIGITNIFGIQMLIPLGQERCVLYSEIAGAIVDLIINWLLIPKYGASGAAIGTLVAEAVVLIVQIYYLKKYVKDIDLKLDYKHILLALALACLAGLFIKSLNLSAFIALVISAILYFSIYGIILIIFKDQLTIEILNIVKKKLLKRA